MIARITSTAITKAILLAVAILALPLLIIFYFLSRVVSHPVGEPTHLGSSGSRCPYTSAARDVIGEPELAQIFVPNFFLKQNTWQWSPGICVLNNSLADSCVFFEKHSPAHL